MSRELVCSWLKLSTTKWPPEPHILLGVKPGETDQGRIEAQVQRRHALLLRYQITHPETVTEVMNLLAQAYVSVCEQSKAPAREKAADPRPSEKPRPTEPAQAGGVGAVPAEVPPARAPEMPPSQEAAAADTVPEINPFAPLNVEAPDAETPAEPAGRPAEAGARAEEDPVLRAACSAEARRGLCTRAALYRRIQTTRQLLDCWLRAGQFMGATSKLTRRSDAADLVRQLNGVRQHLMQFPPLIGQAGQPGYLVVALARQPQIAQAFQQLELDQRQALFRDWQAGLMLLAAHRWYLREQTCVFRRAGRLGQVFRAARTYVLEHPGIWLVLLALLLGNLAFPGLRGLWVHQILAILALAAGVLAIHEYRRNRSWLYRCRKAPVRGPVLQRPRGAAVSRPE